MVEIAREELKDIIIHLQSQVISNLKIAWQQDSFVNFHPLQDASDLGQDRAVLCLLQLYQRLLVAAPINDLAIAASTAAPVISPPQGFIEPESRQQSWATQVPIYPDREVAMSFESTKKRSHRFSAAKITLFRKGRVSESAQKRTVNELDSTEGQTSSTSPGNTLRGGIGLGIGSLSKMNSTSTDSSPNIESDNPEFNPWNMDFGAPSPSESSHLSSPLSNIPRSSQVSPSSNSDHRFSQSSGNSWQSSIIPDMALFHHNSRSHTKSPQISPSFMGAPPTGSSSISQRNCLPGENNSFAGFCKGAWKLQIGEKKNAMEERARPAAVYAKNNQYYKCKKCNFEGLMVEDASGRKGVDTRVYSAEGIQYRWEFLFKSHVRMKGAMANPSLTFGCIFCCAEGKGTPTFGGVQSFIAHLQEHRGRLPTGEVLYRTNCIVGEVASPTRDFDINLSSFQPSEDVG